MGVDSLKKLAVSLLVRRILCEEQDLVDWGDWHEEPTNPSVAIINSSSGTVFDTTALVRPGYRGRLHSLVNECSQRLHLRGITCDLDDGGRVPYMESGDLACGFETRKTPRVFEELAARYTFHFVGDSTTRRLAESFIAISTGTRTVHEKFQGRKDLSVGGLQVHFYWARYCKRELGDALEEILDDQVQENYLDGGRQAIIVTASGLWDAVHGTCDMTALSACSDVVTRLSQVAQISATMEETGGDTAGNTTSLPPLVFLLQNNAFHPGSKQDLFLNDLHFAQRQIVENSEGGVYLVRDRDSVYKPMACYRLDESSIHFADPVKLVEGKMLWDLLALIAGVDI